MPQCASLKNADVTEPTQPRGQPAGGSQDVIPNSVPDTEMHEYLWSGERKQTMVLGDDR